MTTTDEVTDLGLSFDLALKSDNHLQSYMSPYISGAVREHSILSARQSFPCIGLYNKQALY